MEKIVLLCFLMAVIGVLAEWSRAPPPLASNPVRGGGMNYCCMAKADCNRAQALATVAARHACTIAT